MRVLHLPANIASMPSHTVRGLRQIGVEAEGLIFGNPDVCSAAGLEILTFDRRRYTPGWLRETLYARYAIFTRVRRADVIHYMNSAAVLLKPFSVDLFRRLGKPGVVEWMGIDIRIPEVEFEDNPFYRVAWRAGYEYRWIESRKHSHELQQRFADLGFASVVPPGMVQYVERTIFPHTYVVPQRLVLADYAPRYPHPDARPIVIAHSPTAPVAKGTAAVLWAVERLQTKYPLEFRLIQGTRREQALELVAGADIFVDQLVLGDRGMASLEAMALGKPVVCYLKPAVAALYGPDLPVVNATQDTLTDVLEDLIRDGQRRLTLGRQGRAYVERHHDACLVAHELKAVYDDVIRR